MLTSVAQPYTFPEIREEDLPYSRMVFPSSLGSRMKYGFWRVYTPLHPYVRDLAITLKVVTPPAARQNFLIGKLAPTVTIADMVAYLISQGYGNHFIAWKDEGEAVSLRRVVGFERQYHIRIFRDGEVRGHFEYTPECYPILHYRAVDQQPRTDEFLSLLGDRIVRQ